MQKIIKMKNRNLSKMSNDELDNLQRKQDLYVTRLLWFSIGFVFAILLVVITIK